ncbi:AMIN-like domain-containing (lipo)protein [Streptomyces hypolithicus]
MRRWTTALTALVLTVTGLSVTTASASGTTNTATAEAAATTCKTNWGSLTKTDSRSGAMPLENVRTGRHACYDRIVFDVPGTGTGPIGHWVGYVPQLRQDGTGKVVPVVGGAALEVRVMAPSYDPETGSATYPGRVGRPLPGVNLAGYRTFKDARFVGSFEGDTQIGLGVRARLPFRVTQLPDRLVVDVAHSWATGR